MSIPKPGQHKPKYHAYVTPRKDGTGLQDVDFNGMVIDLISLCKMAGGGKAGLIKEIEKRWDNVSVIIDVPKLRS